MTTFSKKVLLTLSALTLSISASFAVMAESVKSVAVTAIVEQLSTKRVTPKVKILNGNTKAPKVTLALRHKLPENLLVTSLTPSLPLRRLQRKPR